MGGEGAEKRLAITETILPNSVIVAGTLNTDENKSAQNDQKVDHDGAVELGGGIEVQEGITTERVWGYLHMYDKSLKPAALELFLMDMAINFNVHLTCLHQDVVEGFTLASFLFKTSMPHFLAFISRLKSDRPHMIVEGFVKECDVANNSISGGDDTEESSTDGAEDSDSGDSDSDDSDDPDDEGFEGFGKDEPELMVMPHMDKKDFQQGDTEKQSPSLHSRQHCRN